MPATAKHFAVEAVRLIWRLAVYFAIGIGTFLLLVMIYRWAMDLLGVQFAESPGVEPAEAVGLGQMFLLIAALAAWVVTERLGRDRLGPILPFHSKAIAHLLQGMVWGLAGIGATIGAIAYFGGYKVSGLALTGSALAYYIPLWLVVALVNGLAENLAFMGYPLFRVAKTAGWTPAILLVGLIFAAAHLGNPGQNPIAIASLFLIGVLMAMTIRLTGDLWLSVGIHAGVIIGEDLVFSVPDSGVTYTGHLLSSRLTGPPWLSGGDAGPEGSALALLVFAVLLAVLWLVYRPRVIASNN
jgi:hypothetical protein